MGTEGKRLQNIQKRSTFTPGREIIVPQKGTSGRGRGDICPTGGKKKGRRGWPRNRFRHPTRFLYRKKKG